MKKTNIYVTAYSLVSSIGFDAESSLNNISAYRTGIKSKELDQTTKSKLGYIPFSNAELKAQFNLSSNTSRTALLGIIGTQIALQKINTNWRKFGLINGTSVGGIDFTEDCYFDYLNGKNVDLKKFKNHPNGVVTNQIADSIGKLDYIDTISTACSSAANAILQAARLIKNEVLDCVIAGGTDGLSKFTINGFKSLMIYDNEFCRPFDNNRNGINLGEGSGYLVLESEASIAKTKNKPLAILSGWCNAADAYHQTASSPEGTGAIASMKGALEIANLEAENISYINAHGTATKNNDLTELTAIKTIFGENIPPFSSTKAFTGHTLAACGAIESALSIISLERGIIYPNINFSNPMSELNLSPNLKFQESQKIEHVLSNSFGFGGNNTSLIFSKAR